MPESNNKRRIASLALFRLLYNEQRKDIFTILKEFIVLIVRKYNLRSFNVTQIKDYLKTEFEFSTIPDYVISSVIAKFCSRENGLYTPKEPDFFTQSDTVEMNEISQIETDNETVFSELLDYVETKMSQKLSDDEKQCLFQSFCEFLIEESTQIEFAEYISAFVIDKKSNHEFTNRLNNIKEGVVLYTGIKYNDNINDIGSWKTELRIFLDQEILFNLMGYNGELFQQLFYDFYNLVKEVNTKSKRKLIKLEYFSSVAIEIDRFFKIAERIVDDKETLNSSNPAMVAIVQGCSSAADVIMKKVQFFDALTSHSIQETKCDDYYSEHNKTYNIISSEIIDELKNSLELSDIDKNIECLNFVNIERQGRMASGFENVGCILLTASSNTLNIAFSPKIKQNGYVPLATNLWFITNKFWFKLNKGFGDGNYPKSFDVISKAQIILSSQIKESVSKEFELLKHKRNKGELTDSQTVAALAELKSRMKNPEDILEANTDNILDIIKESDIEKYLRERELERIKLDEQKIENEHLNKFLEQERLDKEKQRQEANSEIKNKNNENNMLTQKLINQKKSELSKTDKLITDLNSKKEQADIKISSKIKKMRCVPFIIIIGYLILMLFFTYVICDWNTMEPITVFGGLVVIAIEYGCFAIKGKNFNPFKWIEVDYREKITNKLYLSYGFSNKELGDLLEEKKELSQQINILNSKFTLSMSNIE